ncbi:hypothetical protein AB0K60_13250 [Thermopolyspora sp. NPDC052614]|uniref:hypothetical protein n=1 Tax=Thermopolyspora sp. NPDC052614 TaxID=3155682 RepID=UPI0034132ADC
MTAEPGAYAVGEPITDGVRTVNFFNGRLLTGDDLSREQAAGKALRDRLGLAVGEGVVSGLRVSVPPGADRTVPRVAVTEGVAVNRLGAALRLPRDTLVTLARPAGPASAPPTRRDDFSACSGLADSAPLTVAGVYLLTVAPSAAPVGRAPVSGLGDETAACATDLSAEGVEFRVIRLDLDPALLADTAYLRNRLAHLMFGTNDARRGRLERDPFGTPAGRYGLLDDLRATRLRPAEVPLACLLWTPGTGIGFVDMWSVRRRTTRSCADPDWPEVTGERRTAEGEAIFLQFQEQVGDLRSATAPETIAATDHFVFLPAAGLLPLASGGRRGHDLRVFFQGMPCRGPAVIEAAHVADLLRRSFGHPPMSPADGEAVWLYLVRPNLLPSTPQPQEYAIFTSGHLPYRGDARFDLAYWNYANYARVG